MAELAMSGVTGEFDLCYGLWTMDEKLLFHHHTTMTASDNDSGVSEAPATATTSFIILVLAPTR